MTNLTKREYSLQQLGSKRSPANYIAVPRTWVVEHRLEKGDKLTVYYNNMTDEIIVLAPGARPIRDVVFAREKT